MKANPIMSNQTSNISNSIKVLIVDDDADDYFITTEYLSDIIYYNVKTIWAKNYDEAINNIIDHNPDICFFDYLLGKHTGLDVLKAVRNMGFDLPVIFLTGQGNQKVDLEAMEFGATDYLIKSELNAVIIERSIRYALSNIKLIRDIKAQSQLYKMIFTNAKSIIYLIDSKTLKIIEINDFATQLLGYSREEFLNQLTAQDFFEDKEELKKLTIKLIQSKTGIRDYEIHLKAKNGTIKKCSLSAVIQTNVDNTQLFHGIINDLTQIYEAEQDRLTANRLSIARKFTRAMAHEIRNPLTSIDLSVDQLESDCQGLDVLDLIEIIKRNSKRIQSIISEMMQDSNSLKLEFTRNNIHQILDSAVELVKDRIKFNKITLIKNYTKSNPNVNAAFESLKIAFLNLLVNAVEAINDNGTITITTQIQTDNCFIHIKDNGHGIPEEKIKHIFEPYVTSKQKGTGLGLVTTMNIIKSHNGYIQVHSTLDEGTRFLIILPLLQ